MEIDKNAKIVHYYSEWYELLTKLFYLEEEQSSHGQDDPDGQTQAEEDHDQGEEGQGDFGLLTGAVVSVPRPVEAVVEWHGEGDGGLAAAEDGEEEEADEVAVVLVAHAVVDPRAVVVHFHHTTIAWIKNLKWHWLQCPK